MAKVVVCQLYSTCRRDDNDFQFESEEALRALKVILLQSYEHILCKYEAHDEPTSFSTLLHLPLESQHKAEEWLNAFQRHSFTTLKIARGSLFKGVKLLYKGDFQCQHNIRLDQATTREGRCTKQTQCPMTLVCKVRCTEPKLGDSRSKDSHLPKFPCTIKLNFCHNHSTNSASAREFRPVGNDTKDALIALFRSGHSPSSALFTLKYDLQLKHGAEYVLYAGDRQYCSDVMYCHGLFHNIFSKEYDAMSSNQANEEILEKVKVMHEEGSLRIKGENFKGHLVTSFISPFMQNVHKSIKHSGEMVFMDATGTLEIAEPSGVPVANAFSRRWSSTRLSDHVLLSFKQMTLLPSFDVMFSSYEKNVTTDAALASAMHTFGKYASGGITLSQGSGVRDIMSHRKIRVQLTAIARRKLLTGNRTRAALGRPHSKCLSSKRPSLLRSQVLPSRKVPHKLATRWLHVCLRIGLWERLTTQRNLYYLSTCTLRAMFAYNIAFLLQYLSLHENALVYLLL
ncbi:hypothetical protein CAPTEDRAFT_213324 [Capitella teleta]|uniref:Uncharacterized protein n=1 Tax=Capitella teleta TaxID=283909 RepID=R7TPN5_CAPTE|nr:hypothetical protein CAPTEDRAFT_213324 [Capitella teleta]|eukprot:ELT95624.1 hypothetical protein CAPTEDRAFT_213324 [Capitella teleta]